MPQIINMSGNPTLLDLSIRWHTATLESLTAGMASVGVSLQQRLLLQASRCNIASMRRGGFNDSAWNLLREKSVVTQTGLERGAALHIRVFIVSNVRLHREGLAALLRECPSIEVSGAHSVQETQSAPPAAAFSSAPHFVTVAPPPSHKGLQD